MNNRYGSFWEKWDLHVHTPFSVLNNGDFGSAFGETNKNIVVDRYIYQLFTKAIAEKIQVIGLTDYFIIEGYKEVKHVLKDSNRMKSIFATELTQDAKYLEKIMNILILPNIEFRLNLPIFERKDTGTQHSKYQIHVIFSNDVTVQDIEENFLHRLNFIYDSVNTNISKHTLTLNNIMKYGKALKAKNLGGSGSDLFVGVNNVSVDFTEMIDVLNEEQFRNKFIIVLPEEDQSKLSWNDQTSGIRKNMYAVSHAIFSSNEKTIKWATGEECYQIIDKHLPCIWGSDAHEFDKMFKPDLEKYTWIKADTTFEGLLMALKNFGNRIDIGKEPKEMIYLRKRIKYTIEYVSSKLKDVSNKPKVWFDINLKINPLMVTIIGNKGSGKSALSDIIGFLGNTYNSSYFSFLHKDRFLSKRTKYGALFNSTIKFLDNESIYKNELLDTYNPDEIELVKYLPQKYIEEVCNDLGDSFQKEINDAIFSYINVQDKAGSNNLKELVDKKIELNHNNLIDKRTELEKINSNIRRLENKNTKIYKQEISTKMKAQEKRLSNHIQSKPKEVKPVNEEVKNSNSEHIAKLNQRIATFEVENISLTKESSVLNEHIQLIENFIAEATKQINKVDEINTSYIQLAQKLELPNQVYAILKTNDELIKNKYDSIVKKKLEISKLIDDTNVVLGKIDEPNILDYQEDTIDKYLQQYASLSDKKKVLQLIINQLSQGVTLEEQNYLNYQNALKVWETTKQMYEGVIPNIIDGESVKKYQDEIHYVEHDLMNELKSFKQNRIILVEEIYDEYTLIINKYKEIYTPIQEKINAVMKSDIEKIEFKALINVNSKEIKEEIINFIDTRADSDFKGKVEGFREIDNIVSSTDFDDKKSVMFCINQFLDKTTGNPDNIDKILSKPESFYNYLTKLDFLKPEYSIMSGGKNLVELSPGERGIILLIFYLALSKDNMPLIIDQPEDNLDNQSVYGRLVPAILEAKKNRQVIIVTHNPNIAIACDSEQVVYCSIDKFTGELIYESGSIENQKIMENIIDVLEGTRPAFDKRKITYE